MRMGRSSLRLRKKGENEGNAPEDEGGRRGRSGSGAEEGGAGEKRSAPGKEETGDEGSEKKDKWRTMEVGHVLSLQLVATVMQMQVDT